MHVGQRGAAHRSDSFEEFGSVSDEADDSVGAVSRERASDEQFRVLGLLVLCQRHRNRFPILEVVVDGSCRHAAPTRDVFDGGGEIVLGVQREQRIFFLFSFFIDG